MTKERVEYRPNIRPLEAHSMNITMWGPTLALELVVLSRTPKD